MAGRKRVNGPSKGKLAIVADGSPRTEGSAAADTPSLGECPPCPETMKTDPKLEALWNQIAPGLFRDGLVSVSDLQTIELALRHFQVATQASDDLMSEDLIVWDEANHRWAKNPLEAVFRLESKSYLEFAKQLGMTFVSRARTPGRDHRPNKDEENPFMPHGETG